MCLKRLAFLVAASLFLMTALNTASSQEIDCLKCHGKLKKQKVVHAALDMGCTGCHSGVDAVPHKKKAAKPKFLSTEQPELCFGCHDQNLFSKKTVHAAVAMGCSGCHNPHSSNDPKLLRADAPDLCFNCHDKSAFSGKTTHAPVEGGMCMSCHTPHSSDEMALLIKKPYNLCLDCHEQVTTKPHAISGFGSTRHPLGAPKKITKLKDGEKKEELKVSMDPARPESPFYCGSCHQPHQSDTKKLLRFNARSGMDLCTHCHNL